MTLQKMLSLLRKGITQYKLIKDGDRIAVGLSGGKDSVILLKLLAEYKRFSPEKFELGAITVDLNFENQTTDFNLLKEYCNDLSVPYHIEKTDIGKIVFDARKEQSPCALCAKMRKGALCTSAKELGYNKIALGHHMDDLIETMFLSLFYEGRLSTFSPKSYLSRTDLTMIRPMLYIKECDISAFSKGYPVVKSCCPANDTTKRDFVKKTVSEISKTVPNVREMTFTALTHPERYNLFDKFEKDADLL